MDSANYKNIVVCCPLCRTNKFVFFESAKDAEDVLTYNICTTCGLVLQPVTMKEDDLHKFYGSYYREKVQGTETPTEKDLRIQAGRARYLVKRLKHKVAIVKKHMDIGSSGGLLLREIRKKYSCECVGIEPGDAYRKESQSQGFQIYQQIQELPQNHRGSFDCISIIQTLEHIPEPIEYLRDLRKEWMAPNGILLVETPNLFGHSSLEFTHLMAFSPRTLRQSLEIAGFKILDVHTHGEPRSPILRLYITIIAQALPLDAPIRKPHFRSNLVKIRRRWAMWALETLTKNFPNWTWRDLPSME